MAFFAGRSPLKATFLASKTNNLVLLWSGCIGKTCGFARGQLPVIHRAISCALEPLRRSQVTISLWSNKLTTFVRKL